MRLVIFGQNTSKLSYRNSVTLTLGGLLRSEREKASLPLRSVAEKTGIDISLLGKIERNERQPTKEQVRQLAAFYGLDEKDMLRESVIDQVAHLIMREDVDIDVLKAVSGKIGYLKSNSNGR